MPRGYRFLLVALGGLSFLIALGTGSYFGALYGYNQKQYQAVAGNQRSHSDYSGPSQSLPDISGLPGPVERAIANPHPATGQDHEIRDLAAQEASALWAFWMVAVSFASVLVTAVGTIFLYKQIVLTREAVEDTGNATKAMERQNELAEETAKRQLRAYMGLEAADVARIADTDPPKACLSIRWRNVGQTPAHNVQTCVEYIMADRGWRGDWKFTAPTTGHSVTVVFPTCASEIMGSQIVLSEHECFTAGERDLFIFSRGTYWDAFDVERVTKSRWVVRGDRDVTLSVEDIGNDAT